MRYVQGLELFVLSKSGNLVEMGIRRREKTRACKLGNAAEDVMGSLFARERWES